jgi:hypothetical protein
LPLTRPPSSLDSDSPRFCERSRISVVPITPAATTTARARSFDVALIDSSPVSIRWKWTSHSAPWRSRCCTSHCTKIFAPYDFAIGRYVAHSVFFAPTLQPVTQSPQLVHAGCGTPIELVGSGPKCTLM